MHTLPTVQLQQPHPSQFVLMLIIAALITFALFVGMQKLISNDHITPIESKNYPVVDLASFVEDTPLITRTRIKPKPIPQPKPDLLVKVMESEPKLGIDPSSQIPSIGGPVINNTFTPTFTQQGGDARPIVRVEPKYPSVAARDGIEGWVKLSFSITTSGTVNNIKVIDAQPKRTFNQAAKRALAKWKYKPNIQQGKAHVQDGMMVMLDFKLAS